jgi:hypothetical protein
VVRGMLVGHVARVEVVVGEVEEKSSRGRVAETGGGCSESWGAEFWGAEFRGEELPSSSWLMVLVVLEW